MCSLVAPWGVCGSRGVTQVNHAMYMACCIYQYTSLPSHAIQTSNNVTPRGPQTPRNATEQHS